MSVTAEHMLERIERAASYRARWHNRRILARQWACTRKWREPVPNWLADKRSADDVHAYEAMMARRRYPSMLRPIWVGGKLVNANSAGFMGRDETLIAYGLACRHGKDPDDCMHCADLGRD